MQQSIQNTVKIIANTAQPSRRTATRSTRANDENAAPVRSQAGTSRTAAKATVVNGTVKTTRPTEGVKVGVKRERNVLGAVTNIRVRFESNVCTAPLVYV